MTSVTTSTPAVAPTPTVSVLATSTPPPTATAPVIPIGSTSASPPPTAVASPTATVPLGSPSPTPLGSTPTPVVPSSPPSAPPSPPSTTGSDTPPHTTTGCDLAVGIGLLETIPGTYQVSVGIRQWGAGGCPPPTTLNVTVTPSGGMALGALMPAWEYNGSGSWTCSGTSCVASLPLPGNPLANQYQVGFQTMGTLSGAAQLCAAVANAADVNSSNDSTCEALP
ncbi:MAG: hypothetical protein RMH81_07790 [Thermomicrobium sp.]|nr:hypothetical protein [Thermomicrobium sp.]